MAESGSHVDGDRDRDCNHPRQEQEQQRQGREHGQLHMPETPFVIPDGLFPTHCDASADELELGFPGAV